ncbi:DUF6497 family protein [Tropicibacter sp. S64]|uniref:DUF6497 family protein n=1 Tax=Tropicibacter sp. S64 TaxID=3415122 RepID=UPI003C79CBF5
MTSALPAQAGSDEAVPVPSGQDVSFHDMIWDEPGGGLTYRFRFLAPAIAEGEGDFDAMMADMEALCTGYALPRLADIGPQPGRIVITLMSAPVEFGVMTPDVTQFFESFSVADNACIWEAF